jgi:hypothetical protein
MTDITQAEYELIRRYLANGLTEEEELMVTTRIRSSDRKSKLQKHCGTDFASWRGVESSLRCCNRGRDVGREYRWH